jgi:hypothetical protein
MGAVYEAEQASLGRRVAVKVLWPRLTQEPGLAGRFNREARIAARLEHPHILPVYGFGQEDSLLYLVMRLVRGGSLKDRLRGEGLNRRGWPPREVLELARQALPPLDYAHRQGVIHRDLKPDNILLEPSDDFPSGYRAFLSDFGIARVVQGEDVEVGLTQTGGALGTPTYMAPEQVLEQEVDGRADLYAFGVLLYELLVGQVPFRGQTPLGVAMQHVRQAVPAPREVNPQLTPDLEAVLLRCLAKERDERFPSGAALLAALSEAVETAARPTARRPAPSKPAASSTQTGSLPQATAREVQRVREPSGARPGADRPAAAARQVHVAPAPRPARAHRSVWVLVVCIVVASGILGLAWFVGPRSAPASEELVQPSPVATQPLADVAVDPRAWVVTAADLGPEWTTTRESTAGSTSDLAVYEVEYATQAGNGAQTMGFSLFAARSAAAAQAGLEQLRQTASARGVSFEPDTAAPADQPAWLGHSTPSGDNSRLSLVRLFEVDQVVAVVETIGPADQQSALATALDRAAQLQRQRLRDALR